MLPELLPGAYCTVIPEPARLVMPCNGVTVPEDVTAALPPPTVRGEALPLAPMTAIDRTVDVFSGSTLLLRNRTVLSAAICRAVVLCAADVTVAPVEPCGALSNRPNVNISVRMRPTMLFSLACDTWPFCTAVWSEPPKKLPEGISMSIPALADPAVECVPPQSEVTKPGKANWVFNALFINVGFWHANTPLMVLYEHIAEDAAPCCAPIWKCGR